jgi:hypothetical protein
VVPAPMTEPAPPPKPACGLVSSTARISSSNASDTCTLFLAWSEEKRHKQRALHGRHKLGEWFGVLELSTAIPESDKSVADTRK